MPSETAPRTAHDLLDAILAPTGEVAPGVLRPAVREHTRDAYDALYRTPQVLPAPVLHALAVVTAEWQGSGALAAWHRAQGADPSLAAADGSPAEALRAPALRSVYEVDVEVDAREGAVEVRPRVDAAGFTRTGARLAELDEHGGIRADAVAAVPR
ncbi:hypothetical protein [Brachybacterium paraconglomeratum]|uniref:hypothetical protein n=1 Tax=Brachybacterium paraconglomeratum TaxID=173362 RepID=UPI0024929084|nr:hypothetical protein [Brachybacterium paraconglomeratum]